MALQSENPFYPYWMRLDPEELDTQSISRKTGGQKHAQQKTTRDLRHCGAGDYQTEHRPVPFAESPVARHSCWWGGCTKPNSQKGTLEPESDLYFGPPTTQHTVFSS